MDLLATLAPTLEQALAASGEERRLLLDGTLLPAWRCGTLATEANGDPMYDSKHRDHGMNVQVLTNTGRELVFLGKARPGSTHDLTAARADGIIDAATAADVEVTADSGYQGACGTTRTLVKRPQGKGHNGWEKKTNSAIAKLRAPVERPFAALKRWRALDRVRISAYSTFEDGTPGLNIDGVSISNRLAGRNLGMFNDPNTGWQIPTGPMP